MKQTSCTPPRPHRRRHFISIVLCFALLATTSSCALQQIAATASDQVLEGRVVRVYDGDTIELLDASEQTTKVRLKGIDAPEKTQPFGARARQQLSSLIFDKDVQVLWSEKDLYGRTIGKVLSGNSDVCLEMIRKGLAWHYKRYEEKQSSDDRDAYSKTEKWAREQTVGLWAERQPVPPWEYRKH